VTLSQPLTVMMDPRVKTPLTGLTQQFQLATKVCTLLQENSDALQQEAGDPALRAKLTAAHNQLVQLLAVLEGGDNTPTTQAARAVAELNASLHIQLNQWQAAHR